MVKQTLSSFKWLNPTRVIFGVGELSNLASIINETGGSSGRVFLVTGRRTLKERGILQRIVESIGPARVTLFDQVAPFPSPDLFDQALALCRAANPQVVVGIGGGSVLDLAKAVAILMAHDGTLREFSSGEKRIERPGLPFIAVPTTSGSSSEVTAWAVFWDLEAKRSIGLGSPLMFPTVALVDPELATTMPKTLAAATGMDAFTSAFESYWSSEAEPISDALNLEVIRLYAANLERSCIEGDLESRSACALASTMSGIAYSNSHPNVCHVFAAPLTLGWGVAHGQAVGISLTSFLLWNAPSISHKLPALWRAMDVSSLEEATERINQIMERCGLKIRLHELGIGEEDVATILEHVRWDRLGVLPRPLDKEQATTIIQNLM